MKKIKNQYRKRTQAYKIKKASSEIRNHLKKNIRPLSAWDV